MPEPKLYAASKIDNSSDFCADELFDELLLDELDELEEFDDELEELLLDELYDELLDELEELDEPDEPLSIDEEYSLDEPMGKPPVPSKPDKSHALSVKMVKQTVNKAGNNFFISLPCFVINSTIL